MLIFFVRLYRIDVVVV